jgi:cyclase
MSKFRLIPKLQLKPSLFNSKKLVLVITRQFKECIEIGDPVSQAKIFQDQASDELIFINIDENSKSEIKILADVINRVSQEIFMPMTVGGGVKEINDFRLLLANGADKISINSEAFKSPELISKAADKFGAQCVVVSIDYKQNEKGEYTVFINGGKQQTNMHPAEWAQKVVQLGAGELLITCIDRDGMKSGLDITMTRMIADSVNVPVITGGGCGVAKHFSDGFLLGKANAVSAGTFFAHRDQNFIQTRSQISNAGVEIRKHR